MEPGEAKGFGEVMHELFPAMHDAVWAAWIAAEGGNGGVLTNPLNLRNEPSGDPFAWVQRWAESSGGNGFAVFPTAFVGLVAAWQNLLALHINVYALQTDRQQLEALAASPWDVNHYSRNGVQGQLLLDAYEALWGKLPT
jgi:hypothetical protein